MHAVLVGLLRIVYSNVDVWEPQSVVRVIYPIHTAKAGETMRDSIRSAIIVLAGIVIVAAGVYGYNMTSTSAIQGLHDRYDTIIEAHVLIPPATASTPGQGRTSEIFTVNATSMDFGAASPGAKSVIKVVSVSNTGVIPTLYLHVSTDLNTPGVTLMTSETRDLTIFNRKIVSAVGVTFPSQMTKDRVTKTPSFQIEVAPNTAGIDLTFHITLTYSYLPP